MNRKFLRYLLRIACGVVFKRYDPFVIAITGNTGKTTTKEAIFSVLVDNFDAVRSTKENLNTDIGVPLGILGLKNPRNSLIGWLENVLRILSIIVFGDKNFPKYFVLELAADKPGEIEYFMKFIPVDVGIVTTIGQNPVHLEFFPNKDRLIEEKSWLVKGIKKEGTIILNSDDEDVLGMKNLAPEGVKFITYGVDKKLNAVTKNDMANVLFASLGIGADKGGQCFFSKIDFFHKGISVQGKFDDIIGDGYAYAFAAAASCGLSLNIPLGRSIKALEKNFLPLPGRLNVICKKIKIIDDSYNASPLAYYNALSAINSLSSSIHAKKRKVLILGDMAELGLESDQIHKEVFKKALEVADVLVLVGKAMGKASEGHRSGKSKIIHKERNSKTALTIIKKIIKSQDIVLVKGSHAMQMNLIVEGLMDW